MATNIDIINRALARIGCLPISSLDEPVPRVENVTRIYQTVLEDLLSKGPWHFARRTAPLSRLAAPPPDTGAVKWSAAYTLPPDRVGLPRGYFTPDCSRPLTDFQLTDNQLWTNASVVWAEYPIIPIPANWPGYFRELVILAVGAEYAGSEREDFALRRQMRLDCYGSEMYQGEGGQMGIALSLEAQSAPAAPIDGGYNPLIAARWTGASGDARSGFEDWP